MCGIFAVLNNKNLDKNMLEQEFMKGKVAVQNIANFKIFHKIYLWDFID